MLSHTIPLLRVSPRGSTFICRVYECVCVFVLQRWMTEIERLRPRLIKSLSHSLWVIPHFRIIYLILLTQT